MSQHFGTKLNFEGYTFYTFPKPTDLARLDKKELRKCGLGFRDRRVLETAKLVDMGEFNPESLSRMDYFEAKKTLIELPGVGSKVADCVLLFSLEKLEAFPIDVWMKKVACNFYKKHFDDMFIKRISKKGSPNPKEYEILSSFGRKYFGEYAGYAQEYLFHLIRNKSSSTN